MATAPTPDDSNQMEMRRIGSFDSDFNVTIINLLNISRKSNINEFYYHLPVVAVKKEIKGLPNRTVLDTVRATPESGTMYVNIIVADGSRTEVKDAAASDTRVLRRAA